MGLVRFSSGDYPKDRRSSRYSEVLSHVLDLEKAGLDGAPLEVDASLRLMSNGMTIAISRLSPLSMKRTAAHVADGNDNLVLSMPLTGEAHYRHGRNEVQCGPGEAVIMPGDKPSYIANRAMTRLSLSLPRNLLDGPLKDAMDKAGSTLPASPALGLLTNYAHSLLDEAVDLTPELEALASSHICDILGMALGTEPADQEDHAGSGVRAARLMQIREYILRNLHRRDLTVELVAKRAGISHRYLQALFRSEETTFRDFVRNQRLERAYARLADPGSSHLNISEIAFSCGFGDLSYFNQAFRARYAMTPGDVRHAHRRNQPRG